MDTATVGNIIYGADFNTVQSKAAVVLGDGSAFGSTYGPGTANPDYGYNQTLASSLLPENAIVAQNQFQLLANDVNTVALHQTNANFSGYSTVYANTGTLVSAVNLNTLDTAMSTYLNNRTTAHPLQLDSSALFNYWRSTNWGGVVAPASIAQSGTFTFASANAAQYFFNQGGRIEFQGTYRGVPPTPQDTSWQTELGLFTYTINAATYAGLTGTPTVKYSDAGGGLYALNVISLQLSRSGAVITYTVTYNDAHGRISTGPDTVTGSATVGVGVCITPFTSKTPVIGTAPTIGVTAGSTIV
jgi:hypothetical protein